jgi:DNA-binding GntR family transcriptional regulator
MPPRTAVKKGRGAAAHPPAAPRDSGPVSVYEELRDRIVRGRLAPGSRLVESEIAAFVGVSRTPVRAALERLRQERFVVGTGGTQLGRATVAPLTKEDAREIYLIVAQVEGLAASEAARQPKAVRREMVRDMRRTNAEFRSVGKARFPNSDRLHDLDDTFHHRYVNVGAGPRLLSLHGIIKPQAERYARIYTSTLVSAISTSAAEHDAIVRELEAGDPEGAQRAVQTNWQNAAKRLVSIIATVGERGSW